MSYDADNKTLSDDADTSYSYDYITKIVCTTALQHYHSGIKIKPKEGLDIDTRAAVGNLTKNVKIEGANFDSTNHKGHILVNSFVDYSTDDILNPPTRVGQINISNVEILNMGQKDSERSAIKIENGSGVRLPTELPKQSIKDCTVYASETFGIFVNQVDNVDLINNFVFEHLRHGIYVNKAEDVSVKQNLVLKSEPRPG